MFQRENGRQLIIIGIVVVIIALLLFFVLSSRGGGGSGGTAAQEKTKPVVIAVQTIPQGTTFRAGQPLQTFFTVKKFPQSLVPFGAYHSVSQIASVVKSAGCLPSNAPSCLGQITTTQTIYQNIPIVSGMFSTLGQYRQSLGPSFQIPLGYVGIAIALTDVNSVLGSIQPGDAVDLMASYVGGGSIINGLPRDTKAQTQYVLNNVKVIGVGGPPPAANTTSSGSSSTTTTSAGAGGSILVLARFQDALIIQHLKDAGWTISAVLRSAKEPTIPHFRTRTVTDKYYFTRLSNPFKINPGY